MKRVLLVLVALAALALPAAAQAHPLGNFTVNRFAGIEVAGSSVYVRYVLDLAEIPSFQEGGEVRAPGFAEQLARGLDLRLDGTKSTLTVLDRALRSRSGAGGLPTLRFEVVFEAAGTGRTLTFHDRNYADRLGWREVVIAARDGARLVGSDVPAVSTSDALRRYPSELLDSPPDVSAARARFVPGSAPGAPPEVAARTPAARESGGFESLVATELGGGAIVLALIVAAFWGAAHALTPGHGKAIVAGYLVGSRGKPRHAVGLGLIVAATHTAGVFALGAVTLVLSQFVVPERLYPWLTVASGLLVVAVGASVLRSRLRHRRARAHVHVHHGPGHSHDQPSRSGLLGIGIAAGILPCPSALVVLLSAIALHRVGLGLALIVAFSVGLAATIAAIGLVAVLARRAFSRARLDGRFVRALPALSALVIVAVGIGLTARALPEVF